MTLSKNPFDQHISSWKTEQDQPWMDLRYRLEYQNICRHIDAQALTILDAGGGNAANAIQFAQKGHHVTVVDSSPAMLADGLSSAQESGVVERIKFIQADLSELPKLFPDPRVDLVLCHNVIQYLDDPDQTLRALVHLLRSGGFLSLVTVNGYAEVYKAAFRELDLEKAAIQLNAEETHATVFDVSMRRFSDEAVIELVKTAGCNLLGLYGVRSLCDWLPNEPKYNPEFFARLEELEFKLADRYPYYLLARFYQAIGQK